MTDTVNVEREVVERLSAVAEGGSPHDVYGSEAFVDVGRAFRADLTALLAAAPKAEPVSDPYKLEPLLWSMHILGPDDVYPAPDLETAFKWCECVNTQLAPRTPDVLCAAIPALWDGTPEQHAKSLPEAMKGWAVPAHPEAPKVEQEPVMVPEVFWSWLVERGLAPDDPDFNWNDIVEILNEHENELIRPAPASDELLEAAVGLRAAQRAYMADRGNEALGKAVGVAAGRLDQVIAKHKGPQS